ncbi:MAG: helix-turn-helix transcriptional regulator [Oscillospiraceae bacterium]|nr:helix-turn-helix transcriptional regulator [Oscillospiraceae bacterium]
METETENEIGRVLARLRRENGFSQERLALLLGVTRQAVSKWECGMARSSVENLYRISEVYDIPIRELTALLEPQDPAAPPPPPEAETTAVLLEPETETGPDADAEPEISAPVPEPEADAGPAVAPPKQRRRWSRRKKTITALAVLLLLAAGLLAIRAWTWQWKNDALHLDEINARKVDIDSIEVGVGIDIGEVNAERTDIDSTDASDVMQMEEMEQADVNDLIIDFWKFD